jgi:methylmalonyl-CoA mutase
MTKLPELPALNAGFPPANQAAWMALVDRALKGAADKRRLSTATYDGIAIEPIYDRSTAIGAGAAVAAVPWSITARVDHPTLATAATLALEDLEGGADQLALALKGSASARGFGLDITSAHDLDACLDGVVLDLIHLRIEPHASAPVTARHVAGLAAKRRHDPSKLRVTFGFDPIGTCLPGGGIELGGLGSAINQLRSDGFRGPFITCDLRPASEAGASEALELAFGLASGVAYGRSLTVSGVHPAAAFGYLAWTIAVDADQFLGLAKLRALRRLWARVEAAWGVAPQPMAIHAETAWRMLTKRDAAVNMLRSTTAAFTAAVGGADSISILPHTSAFGLPDILSRRIARNTQLVLQEEAHLWRVADPAAGAGAIEALTTELCQAAWRAFQQIEAEGGLVESLRQGALQARIAAVANARRRDIATRKAPLTGTSEFPALVESKGGFFIDVAAAAANSGLLPSERLAEPFEVLRDAADRAAAATGQRPRVFLANLGAPAEHGARASWIAHLLAAGGIEAMSTDGFTASGAVGAAFAASEATVACICGSDATYSYLAEATAMALKSAGARHVALAGRPGVHEADWSRAGVDQFIFAGQDVIAALGLLHGRLGIRSDPA